MLIDKLTEHDKELVEDYISYYAAGDGISVDFYNRKQIDDILKYWNAAKGKYLYDLLGKNFIVKKPVKFIKNVSILTKEFNKEDYDSPIQIFVHNFRDTVVHNDELFDLKYDLFDLVEDRTLASNKYEGEDFEITLKGQNKPFKVTRGMKVNKILSKLASVYNISGYEEFRIRCSQLLNTKEMHGTLCLSIHPLDYMTMSDNESGWSSCMSWMECGAYRSGTIEMMNSECVLMAYLEAEDNMSLGFTHKEWNNKKWRELFIVTDELITEVKGYPYQSDELVTEVIDWIQLLAKTNLGWNYFDSSIKHYGKWDPIALPSEEAKSAIFKFRTKNMYNDFGSKDYHLARLGSIKESLRTPYNQMSFNAENGQYTICSIIEVDLEYSGVCECMVCGCNMEYDASDLTTRVVCGRCGAGSYCDCCGESVYEDDLIWVDDERVCSYCLSEYFTCDDITGEYYRNEDCIAISIASTPDKPDRYTDRTIYVCGNANDNSLTCYLPEDVEVKLSETTEGWNWNHKHYYYINYYEVDEKLARIFGYRNLEDFQKQYINC